MRHSHAILCVILGSTLVLAPAQDPPPAATGLVAAGQAIVLDNGRIRVRWQRTAQGLQPAEISDLADGTVWPQTGNLFAIEIDGNPVDPASFALMEGPTVSPIASDPQAARAAGRVAGRQVAATFRTPAGVTVGWRAEVRDGSAHVRQILTISGTAGTLTRVTALNADIGTAQVQGSATAGNPVTSERGFVATEMPMGINTVTNRGTVRCDLPCKLPLMPDQAYEVPAVIGLHAPGQLRRDFLRYLERERATPYRQFLHWNGWFDFDRNLREAEITATIAAYHRELITKRGVPMNAFVIDDGWDDWNSGFWTVDPVKFPNGFAPVTAAVDAAGSRFGIWISPLAGYANAPKRIAHAATLGLTVGTDGLDLSHQPYYAWFRDRCASLVRQDHVSYFKFDKAGSGATPHFLALLRLSGELRRLDPTLFINVTVGTWPSPFWLNHIDCTWRGGQDMGAEGPGDEREQWITYRDAQTWRGVVSKAPLYPLNSIMTHGIVHSNGHHFAQRTLKAGNDLRHEARSYVASGTGLQELYIKPAIVPAETWDQLAEALRWGRANADILVDTHWVGGDPTKGGAVYGWAAWTPRKGLLTLRNPAAEARSITLDVGTALELPRDAATRFTVASAYADTPSPLQEAVAGTALTISLQPFAVLVLELTPRP